MTNRTFFLLAAAFVLLVFGLSRLVTNDYFFFAGYIVLQFVAMATAWNILGGYAGYVNFGVAGFFALGAYTSVVLYKLLDPPVVLSIAAGGIVAGIVGLAMGYLTLRIRGIFFAIATLALAIVMQTLVTNWDFVGGSRGTHVLGPAELPVFGSYIQYLFFLMLALAVSSVCLARWIEQSKFGFGLAAIRDDEGAAEVAGVPTLRLKLVATVVSGALLGMAGAPFPYYVTYIEPVSAFSLTTAVNTIAMPMVGGTASWLGPVLGALLLGTLQQVVTVTVSSAMNLLIAGIVLVAFVVIAPKGILGFWTGRHRK